MTERNHYVVLGVGQDADFAALRSAYRARALASHPDRFGGDPEKAEEFRLVAEAFNVLSDPVSRRNYDLTLGLEISGERAGAAMAREPEDVGSILDTYVDDALEELIVGNTVPRNTTLQTLMLDLEKTKQFCLFREAKTSLYKGQVRKAEVLFSRYLRDAPDNILARYFHAQCHIKLDHWYDAVNELRIATIIGDSREPPLRLGRIRRELAQLRRRRPGFLGVIYRLFFGVDSQEQKPVDQQERDALNRAINQLARERLNRPKPRKQIEKETCQRDNCRGR